MKYYNVRVDKDKEISVYLRLTDEDVKHIQDREQGIDARHFPLHPGTVAALTVCTEAQIVLHAQRREHLSPFRYLTDAGTHDAVGRQPGDVPALQMHRSGAGTVDA